MPAFAPPVGELGTIPEEEWFVANPYAEWYYNSVNVGRGPTCEHHIKTYGKDFPYCEFIDCTFMIHLHNVFIFFTYIFDDP